MPWETMTTRRAGGRRPERDRNGAGALQPEKLKKKYFTKVGLSYQISEKIKKQVQFVQHNLIKDIYREGWHLIVCRNVLIYFTEEAKNEVFIKFYKALARRGVLFIGNTEQIIYYRTIGYDRRNPFFYEKPV